MAFDSSPFVAPDGLNFSTPGDLPAAHLAETLCRAASFLQNVSPHVRLHRYADWWEHDGLHFHHGPLTWDEVFRMVRSPRSLFEAMPGDEDVFIGVAPEDRMWYLRFYFFRDDEGFYLFGRFDLTLSPALADSFRNEVLKALSIEAEARDADSYYRSLREE